MAWRSRSTTRAIWLRAKDVIDGLVQDNYTHPANAYLVITHA